MRPEAAHVENPRKPTGGHEHVARNQIAMGHDVLGRTSRQIAQSRPDAAKSRDIQELLTVRETGLHPRVMGLQVASSACAGERAATRVDRA